jgi:hypothetical protein
VSFENTHVAAYDVANEYDLSKMTFSLPLRGAKFKNEIADRDLIKKRN